MPILYTVRKKKLSIDGQREEKFYLVAKRWEQISYENLLEDMVRNTTLHAAEARSALDYLQESIPRMLETGNSVSLGSLGRLNVTIKSEGSDTEEEATHHKIKDIRVHFIPGKALRNRIRRLPVGKFPELGTSVKGIQYNNAMLAARRETQREDALESARRCLAEGLSIEQTIRISGLTEDEIRLL